jgi:hypothetical protein
MAKKVFFLLMLVAVSSAAFFSCKKYTKSDKDLTRNYFPLELGKTITYDVDSTYYNDASCTKRNIKCQLKYAITDTVVDYSPFTPKLTYIMTVYHRPYDGAIWTPQRVILLTPTTTGLIYEQDNNAYIKLNFPIKQGAKWLGNTKIDASNPDYAYLKGWNYEYQNYGLSYNNSLVNFENTVTVLEHDASVNYPDYDSLTGASRIYAKEVYAYNVGMIYKEWTHWTYKPSQFPCRDGYTVIMRAIDHN